MDLLEKLKQEPWTPAMSSADWANYLRVKEAEIRWLIEQQELFVREDGLIEPAAIVLFRRKCMASPKPGTWSHDLGDQVFPRTTPTVGNHSTESIQEVLDQTRRYISELEGQSSSVTRDGDLDFLRSKERAMRYLRLILALRELCQKYAALSAEANRCGDGMKTFKFRFSEIRWFDPECERSKMLLEAHEIALAITPILSAIGDRMNISEVRIDDDLSWKYYADAIDMDVLVSLERMMPRIVPAKAKTKKVES
jgi:hypothetical protein